MQHEETMRKGSNAVSLPSHMCPTSERQRRTPVVICAFSRWIKLFLIKTTTTKEIARCIDQHFDRRIDNGPAFANDLLKYLLNLLGSINEFTTAYSSEKNGIVDRANGIFNM
jgi:hypothetical protein